MNKKSPYGQNNQSTQISYKTNQNLDRLSKLSERLNNIHVRIRKYFNNYLSNISTSTVKY